MSDTPDVLAHIRILRAASYRCGYKTYVDSPTCGQYASSVGMRSADEQWVALCLAHSLA